MAALGRPSSLKAQPTSPAPPRQKKKKGFLGNLFEAAETESHWLARRLALRDWCCRVYYRPRCLPTRRRKSPITTLLLTVTGITM
ncbi:hypothetical protein CEXT_531131 [Caerostris extrusa]|uniref:Uncharacterized protein n=1 Tax=Caerostris extrusa TaxID=172846 RepID=A0AAV4XE77_CAEEX|nr:hypothetical protein CEXT_531131 [Caerostris extrusa]